MQTLTEFAQKASHRQTNREEVLMLTHKHKKISGDARTRPQPGTNGTRIGPNVYY